MPNPRHEQMDFRGLELLVDEVTATGGFNGAVNSGVTPVTVTYTAANPNITPDGAITIANGGTPSVSELLQFCVELNAKIAALQ